MKFVGTLCLGACLGVFAFLAWTEWKAVEQMPAKEPVLGEFRYATPAQLDFWANQRPDEEPVEEEAIPRPIRNALIGLFIAQVMSLVVTQMAIWRVKQVGGSQPPLAQRPPFMRGLTEDAK